jgi:hypothetical protein
LNGEIDEAQLGLANMQQSFSDPAVVAELMQRLNDPEFVAQLEEKIADPAFQEQALQVLKELKEKKSSKSLASLLLQMGPSGARLADARTSSVNMETNADLRALAQKLNPAIGYFDPLNLGSADGPTSEPFIGFLRHAEIKHGRVAMAAFIGYVVTANGIRFGSEPFLSTASIPGPIDQFEALPWLTRWNLILGVGFLEGWGELCAPGRTEPHYMRGGKPGYYPSFKDFAKEGTLYGWYPKLDLWDPFGFTKNMSPETKERRLLAEINNGRLAMLGLSGFIAEAKVPGSVPLLNGKVPQFEGDLVYPPGLRWDRILPLDDPTGVKYWSRYLPEGVDLETFLSKVQLGPF